MFWLPRNLKNQEHNNMEHVKSKGIDLQNTKTFKDSKHKEHKPKPNHQSPANPEHHMKSQTLRTNIKPRNKPINFKPRKFVKLTHKFEKPRNKPTNIKPRKIQGTNPQIRETHKQTQKF